MFCFNFLTVSLIVTFLSFFTSFFILSFHFLLPLPFSLPYCLLPLTLIRFQFSSLFLHFSIRFFFHRGFPFHTSSCFRSSCPTLLDKHQESNKDKYRRDDKDTTGKKEVRSQTVALCWINISLHVAPIERKEKENEISSEKQERNGGNKKRWQVEDKIPASHEHEPCTLLQVDRRRRRRLKTTEEKKIRPFPSVTSPNSPRPFVSARTTPFPSVLTSRFTRSVFADVK